jgi:hypothetical protein
MSVKSSSIEVPVEEYWDLMVNVVTLEPGKPELIRDQSEPPET